MKCLIDTHMLVTRGVSFFSDSSAACGCGVEVLLVPGIQQRPPGLRGVPGTLGAHSDSH